MNVKLEKIKELESLGFKKGRKCKDGFYYNYDLGAKTLRISETTGYITMRFNYCVYESSIPDIIKTLIMQGFIEE